MSSVLKRRSLLAVVLAAMVFAMLAMPALAIADTGDGDNPVTLGWLPWSQEVTGSLVATVDAGENYWEYVYKVPMLRGQSAQFTCQSLDPNMLIIMTSSTGWPAGWVLSNTAGAGAQRLGFMAPRTGWYSLTLSGSSTATFTMGGVATPTTKYKMWAFSAPKSKKKNAKFAVSVKLSPRYNSFGSPIQFQVQRKSGTKWKSHTTANGLADNPYYPVKFSANVKIKKKGTFRIRAKFSDVAHAKATYTVWKTIKIK